MAYNSNPISPSTPQSPNLANSTQSAHQESPISPYAQKVYDYLLGIPQGRVVTYGQIAAALGNPRRARVVGNVLHHNPRADLYPCYKVVNAQGRLAPSFAFGGPKIQRLLLEADGIEVINNHVDLTKYQYQPPIKNSTNLVNH